jgi:hypothetical protein
MSKNMIKVIMMIMMIIGFGFGIGSAFASTGSIYYSDGPWKGSVIDAETKQPIEGAVVVAIWRKVYGTPTGNDSYFLDAKEVLTDANGNFLIPKFWKLNVLPFIRWFDGPEFIVFKPGYTAFPGYEYFWKYFPQSPLKVDIDTLAEMFKKGVVVELLKLKTKEERGMNIPGWIDDVGSEKLPLFYGLINEEGRNLGIGEVGRKR